LTVAAPVRRFDAVRPHVIELASTVVDILPVDGALAVLTLGGLVSVDDAATASEPVSIASPPPMRLLRLADGRVLAHQQFPSTLAVGRLGGAFEQVTLVEDALAFGAVATRDGFVAWTRKHVLVEVGGERRAFEHAWPTHGGVRWGERTVLAGSDALTVLGADGTVVATLERASSHTPVPFGPRLAVIGDDVTVLDEALNEVHRLPLAGCVMACGEGLLLVDPGSLRSWHPGGREWSRVASPSLLEPMLVGDSLVIGSWLENRAWIHDVRDGTLRAEVEVAGRLQGACAFGDGLALLDSGSHGVWWWRPSEPTPTLLPHDFTPRVLAPFERGIATADDTVLYLWRTDRDGPEAPAAADGPPLGVPIVAGGELVTLDVRGRFASRGRSPSGAAMRVGHRAQWRRTIGHEEARGILDHLLQRRADGEPPALPEDFGASTRALPQLPLEQTWPLHARALFAPTTLDEQNLHIAAFTRHGFFEELGRALGVSGRVLLASVRARTFPLIPPVHLDGYEYLGAFTSDGELSVSDPCHFGKRSPRAAFTLSLKVEGPSGLWHVYVRPGTGDHAARTAELVAIHGNGFAAYATTQLGMIGVDAGCVGIYDKGCPKPQPPYDEGVFAGQGSLATSGAGDGVYPVYGGHTQGQLSKLRVPFLGPPAPEVDSTIPRTAARRYSMRERYGVGDTLEHPTFGIGTVTKLGADGKIEVLFGGERRVLVHARK
jgi:hypothetical protein